MREPLVREHAQAHAGAASEHFGAAIARLRDRGQRVTAPRVAVLSVLAGRPEHLTADEVAAALPDRDVHRSTVYRTLGLLAENGIVTSRQVPGGAARYHLATGIHGSEHLHGHCASCGVVVVLPADALDAAAAHVRAATGFELAPDQAALVGRCADCAESESRGPER